MGDSRPKGKSRTRGLARRKERRSHPRKRCLVEAQYEVAGAQYVARVMDVSLGGVCLETPQPHTAGDKITVNIVSGTGEPALTFRGVITYAEQKAEDCWRIGIQFSELDRAAMQEVEIYMWH